MTTGAILDQGQQLEMAYLDQRRWEAVAGRDATHDGEFVFAVTSTGVTPYLIVSPNLFISSRHLEDG